MTTARSRDGGRSRTEIAPPRAAKTTANPLENLKAFHARMLAAHPGYALLFAIVERFRQHEPGMLAKQAAYSLLYAIPSILLMLVSLAVIVDKNTGAEVSTSLREAITEQAPDDAQPLLQSLVDNALVRTSKNTAILAAALSLAVAIWGAAGGVGALMFAVNRVYDIRDTRSFFKATLLRLGLMLLGGVLVVGAFLLFTVGRRVSDLLPAEIAEETSGLQAFLSSGPLLALPLLFVSLLLLYWVALDAPKTLKWLLPGTAAATLATIVILTLLDLILTYTNPGPAFGAAGGVIVLLWFLFVLSQIVVVGAIVNAVMGYRFDQKFLAALARDPEKRLRGAPDLAGQKHEQGPRQEVTAASGGAGITATGARREDIGPAIGGGMDRANRRTGAGAMIRHIRARWQRRTGDGEPGLLLLRLMAGISLLVQGLPDATRRSRKGR